MPNQKGITPRYAQGHFADQDGATLILSPNAEQGSFKIYQDMKLWRYQFSQKNSEKVSLDPNRSYWLQMVKGDIIVNDEKLSGADAVGIRDERELQIESSENVEFLLFDLQ